MPPTWSMAVISHLFGVAFRENSWTEWRSIAFRPNLSATFSHGGEKGRLVEGSSARTEY